MICDKCGNFVGTDCKVCTVCGNPINNTTPSEEVVNTNNTVNNNMLFTTPVSSPSTSSNNSNEIIGDDGSYTGYEVPNIETNNTVNQVQTSSNMLFDKPLDSSDVQTNNIQINNQLNSNNVNPANNMLFDKPLEPINNSIPTSTSETTSTPTPNFNPYSNNQKSSGLNIKYGFDDHGRPLSEVNNTPDIEMQPQMNKPDRTWTKILGVVIVVLIVLIIVFSIVNKINISSQSNVDSIEVNGTTVASYTKIVEGKNLINLTEEDKSETKDKMKEYNMSKVYSYDSIKQEDAEMYSDYLYNMEGFSILNSSYLDTILLGKKIDEYNGFYIQISYGEKGEMNIKYSFRNLSIVPTLNIKHFTNSTIIGNSSYGYIDCPKTFKKDETTKDMLIYTDDSKQRSISMYSIESTKTNKTFALELKNNTAKKYKNVSDIEEYKSSNLTEFLVFTGFDEEKDLYFKIYTRKVDKKIIVIMLSSNKKNDEILEYTHSYTA